MITKTRIGNHLRHHALGDQPTFRQGFKEGVAFAQKHAPLQQEQVPKHLYDAACRRADSWERLAEAAYSAPVQQEPVMWQSRFFDSHPDTVTTGTWSEWEEVKPYNPYVGTVLSEVANLEAYRYNGKPVYEVRGLVPASALAALQAEVEMWKATANAAVCMHCDAENKRLKAEVERLTAVNATVTHANKAMHEELEALTKVDVEPACNPHPDAPHGFDRNGSHNAGRYVCECEGWTAPDVEPINCATPETCPDHAHLAYVHVSALSAAKDAAWKEGYKQGLADYKAATEAVYPSPAIAAEQAKVRELVGALREVMTWIDNWSPEFTNDDEWPIDRDAAEAAIAKYGEQK